MARPDFKSFITAGALACALSATPGLAAEVNGTAAYIVSLSGMNIATVNVDLKDDGKAYNLDLNASVSGLGQLVASGTASIKSSGSSTGKRLTSREFDLVTEANREKFSVDISYAGGNVASFKVDPPLVNNIDRVPIERAHLSGVNDMLAAFVFKGGKLDKSLCSRKMGIFTGVERFNIAMSYAKDDVATSARTGYQGPVILCNIRYTPVSGHFTTSEMTNYLADSDRILMWYAPMGDTGFFVPYRLLLTTSVGDLSMVLTKLTY